MPGTVKQFIDYSVNTNNDTGINDAASIQPYNNGESMDATVLDRPPESLRQRSEAVRNVEMDSLFLRDADRTLIITGPGLITWPGSTTASASGIPVVSDALFLLPMLTPGNPQTSPIPPVASAFGTINLERFDSTNAILVTSLRRSYAAGDQISITVVAGASFACTLSDDAVFQRTINIVATNATTLSTVINALNALAPTVAGDTTPIVSAALEGGALGSDLVLTTQAKQFMLGNYDGEGHVVTPANLAAFFTGNPTEALAEGDTLAVSFASVTSTSSTGGRRQSIPENSNTAIPVGSFFNSRVHPELLVNALPICKVVNGHLVFATGCEVVAGSSGFSLSGTSYGGGPNWADGTTNPATTVNAQLSKIVSDLVGATGTGKIEGSAVGTYLGAATLASQISTMANFVHDDRPPTEASIVPLRVLRDWQGNARSLVDHMGLPNGQVSQIETHWNLPIVTVPVPLTTGIIDVGTWTRVNTTGSWATVSTSSTLTFPLPSIPAGAIITSVNCVINQGAINDVTDVLLNLWSNGAFVSTLAQQNAVAGSGGGVSFVQLEAPASSGFMPQQWGGDPEQLVIQIVTSINSPPGTFALLSLSVSYMMPMENNAFGGTSLGKATACDAITNDDPDANLNQRSLHLFAASVSGTKGDMVYTGNAHETYFDADTAFAMEFMLYTGTITDSSNAAVFRAGITGEPASGSLGSDYFIGFNYTGGTAAWQLQVFENTSNNLTSTGVTVVANTLYRMRLEVYGVNRNSTGHTRCVAYINGVKVAEFNTLTLGFHSYTMEFSAASPITTAAGPYDFRVGRVRRTWNNIAAGDVL